MTRSWSWLRFIIGGRIRLIAHVDKISQNNRLHLCEVSTGHVYFPVHTFMNHAYQDNSEYVNPLIFYSFIGWKLHRKIKLNYLCIMNFKVPCLQSVNQLTVKVNEKLHVETELVKGPTLISWCLKVIQPLFLLYLVLRSIFLSFLASRQWYRVVSLYILLELQTSFLRPVFRVFVTKPILKLLKCITPTVSFLYIGKRTTKSNLCFDWCYRPTFQHRPTENPGIFTFSVSLEVCRSYSISVTHTVSLSPLTQHNFESFRTRHEEVTK